MPRGDINQATAALDVMAARWRTEDGCDQVLDAKSEGAEEHANYDKHDHVFAEPARLGGGDQRLRLPLRRVGAEHGDDAVDTAFDAAGNIAALEVRDDRAGDDGRRQ